jgi:hypothetical protein
MRKSVLCLGMSRLSKVNKNSAIISRPHSLRLARLDSSNSDYAGALFDPELSRQIDACVALLAAETAPTLLRQRKAELERMAFEVQRAA